MLKLYPEKCIKSCMLDTAMRQCMTENYGTPKILQQTEKKKTLVSTLHLIKNQVHSVIKLLIKLSVLRMVNRAFRRLDKDYFLIIYKSFIRHHLDYCVQSCNPHYLKDEEVLEKFQKRAIKCVKGLKGKTY